MVEGRFRAQGEQAFSNLQRALTAGGASLTNVVKVTIFLTDMNDFNEIVELRRKYFSAPYPADTIVEVKALYTADAMIEIEAAAVIDAPREDGSWTLPPLAASPRAASPHPSFHTSSPPSTP